MPYRNGQQGMGSGLQPINVKLYISLHPDTKSRDPPQSGSVTLLPVEESTKFLGLWWDSHLSFKEHISALKTQCKEALNLIRVVAHLKWGGDRDTLLMLYWTIVRSKLDYGCIVYGTASNTNLRQLDSIHNGGLRLALGAFCTSPVSSMYTEANEAPLEERQLKLSMNYYLKTRACTYNPAHHALHEFDPTTRDLYLPRPNGKGGMTRPPAKPIGLKVEEAMISAEIDCGLRLALGAFCTSPVSSLYTEANEAPLEERQLKLSMHYYVKTHACTDSPAHHAMHEFDRTTRFICSQAKWKRRHDPTPSPSRWSQSRGSHDLCRHQCMQFGGTGSPQTLPIYAILFCHYACKGAVFTKLPIDLGTRNS